MIFTVQVADGTQETYRGTFSVQGDALVVTRDDKTIVNYHSDSWVSVHEGRPGDQGSKVAQPWQ